MNDYTFLWSSSTLAHQIVNIVTNIPRLLNWLVPLGLANNYYASTYKWVYSEHSIRITILIERVLHMRTLVMCESLHVAAL